MKDENKEIKVSEEMERGGQCELDDNALEQAVGGEKKKSSKAWADDAWEWVKQQYT